MNYLLLLPSILFGLNTFSQDWTTCDDFTDTISFPPAIYSPETLIGYSQGGTQEIYSGVVGLCDVNAGYPGIFGACNVNFAFDGSNQTAQYRMYIFDAPFTHADISVNGSAYHSVEEIFPLSLGGVLVNLESVTDPDTSSFYYEFTAEGVIDSISFILGEAGIIELCVSPLEETGLGVVEETTNQLTTYPNPVADVLTITSNEQLASVKIYTITGDLVLAQPVISDEIIQLSFAELQAGIYFVVGTSLNGDEFVSKIAKN